jgi:PQQ-dependent catabolism-associated CXXCW motif protein
MIAANALRDRKKFLLIDTLGGPHPTIPGARSIPFAGNPGSYNDQDRYLFGQELERITGGSRNYPIVFFCAGILCRHSYNASLRAIALGFTHVYWYRGGLEAWRQAAFAAAIKAVVK